MLIWIFPRNDGTGLLDHEHRDGDIFQAKPDSDEPSIGNQSKKSYLIVKIPDPPNLAAVLAEITRPEYQVGPNPEDRLMSRARSRRIDWRAKLSASEIAVVEDSNAMLPDGLTQGGGTVTSGVVSGLFTAADIIRK